MKSFTTSAPKACKTAQRRKTVLGTLLALTLVSLTLPSAHGQAYKVAQLTYPNSTYTNAFGLNAKGSTVVGAYGLSTGAVEGFVWSGGKFTKIAFPKNKNFTRVFGVTDSGTVAGDFVGADGTFHGFTYTGGKYSQFDVQKGKAATSIFAMNNNGDFAGATGNSTGSLGFVDIAGKITKFTVSGAANVYTYGINITDSTVGVWYDSNNLAHGFSRGPKGKITVINYPGANQTACSGITDAGEIAGTYYDVYGNAYGFLYNKGVFKTVDLPIIFQINNAGMLAGTSYNFASGETFGYVATPTTFNPTTVTVANSQVTQLYDINNAGTIVGAYVDEGGTQHGFSLAGNVVNNIDDPNGAGSTFCTGINKAGQIVGHYTNSQGAVQAYLYSGGTFTDINPPNASSSQAQGINDSGEIAGWYSDAAGNYHGYIYDGKNFTTLDVPGAQDSYAWGINNAGTVTVEWVDTLGYGESSLYSGGNYTTIDPSAASVNTLVHAINNKGAIVYAWEDTAGNVHAAVLSGGTYVLFDDAKGTNSRAAGINDSGEIVGNFVPNGGSSFQGYSAAKP